MELLQRSCYDTFVQSSYRVSAPIKSSFDLPCTLFSCLTSLPWQHRVQLAEVTGGVHDTVSLALLSDPIQNITKVLGTLLRCSLRHFNGTDLTKGGGKSRIIRRDLTVTHPVKGSLKNACTFLWGLALFLGEHSIKLAELSQWIILFLLTFTNPVQCILQV